MENDKKTEIKRVIGIDAHPDSFTVAVLRGSTPASAIVEKLFNRIPMDGLQKWATKNTTEEDMLVLEASGNSFTIARTLRGMNRNVQVLESCHMGKLKEAHANNDKISAIRIGKAYLAGTAKIVWVPDKKTQERRDWFHAHRKAVKRTSQVRSRLLSYLSDNGVRLPKGTRLAKGVMVEEQIRAAFPWSNCQWQVIQILLMELQHADKQRDHWRSLIAQEVASDPVLLSLMRLCGIREIIAFALGALIGDIDRFPTAKKLVKYVGLNPAFDHSGENKYNGGIGGHGRKDLRSLLIEAAHSLIRSDHPIAKWAKKLLGRKGQLKLVVAAVARKLIVAVWYLMVGKWASLTDIDSRLEIKVGKLITTVGKAVLKTQGLTRKQYRDELLSRLKSGRTYSPPVMA